MGIKIEKTLILNRAWLYDENNETVGTTDFEVSEKWFSEVFKELFPEEKDMEDFLETYEPETDGELIYQRAVIDNAILQEDIMPAEQIAPMKKRKSQKSKISKRSNHKHDYVEFITRGCCGWVWAKKCKICGRIDTDNWFGDKDFIKPEYKNESRTIYSTNYFYSEEELRKLYPNVEIITKYLF